VAAAAAGIVVVTAVAIDHSHLWQLQVGVYIGKWEVKR
jgi:hypothetical protein